MRWAEPYAYGELTLMPWDFYRLTVREFLYRLDGLFRREDRDWMRAASLGMWILAPYQKKKDRLTPEKLLNRPLKLFPESET